MFKKGNFNYEDNTILLIKAKEGDKTSIDRLIEINLPLVSSISKRFLNRGLEYEDVFQIGSMGLIKAVNNFDSSFNVKFSTYAVPMIIGEIKRFLRDDGMIKVSRNVKSIASRIHYVKEELSKNLGREPNIKEISESTGLCEEDILVAIESTNNLSYLYDVVHVEDGNPILLIDKVSEKGEEDKNILDNIILKDALKDLDCKSRQVILLRYFKDQTQSQVAKRLGISQVQVSRIEKRVLKIMKERLSV